MLRSHCFWALFMMDPRIRAVLFKIDPVKEKQLEREWRVRNMERVLKSTRIQGPLTYARFLSRGEGRLGTQPNGGPNNTTVSVCFGRIGRCVVLFGYPSGVVCI